jgi:acid phosphatase (class A)
MKKLHFILVLLISSTLVAYAQQKKLTRPLTPARGYYKSLQGYSTKPQSANEEIDKQKFPYDAASAEKRLSLKPYYLENVTPDDFEIPAPPANSSEQTRAELNYLLALQQQRTRLDVAASQHMAGIYYNPRVTPADSTYWQYRQNLFQIGRSVGSWFNPKDLPLTADLMAHVWRDASYFIWAFKYKYQRVRPYILEPELNNLEETNWAAYPSGHAANSYINAYIYQELAPEFADIFLKDAYDMAHSREILGVHYPSDAEASRMLARQLVNKLFENEKFRNDFEAAKKEWQTQAKETFAKPLTLKNSSSGNATSCAKKCE